MREELLSVVIAPGRNPEKLFHMLDRLAEFLPPRFKNYEIIVTCDNSDPAHAYNLSERVTNTRNLRVLTLARHYGEATATLAGLQHAIGDFTILVETETDPSLIDELFDAMTPEFDVVLATDETENDWKNRILRAFEKFSQIPVVTGHACAALIRRQSLNAILNLRERIVHLPLLSAYLGQRITTIQTSQRTPLSPLKWLQQLETVCAYSPWPLLLLAGVVFGIAAIATLLSLFEWIFSGFKGTHFITFLCMISVMGLTGMMALMTSFISRVLQETKRQAFYQVAGERSSRKVEIESIVQRK